ncbi:MAG TPA: hypothetical protein VMR16_03845 [Candidatus Saccharimonadales bacterium]|nr:hypothetical protein [Candidatus Saccharimonadales bacterium]
MKTKITNPPKGKAKKRPASVSRKKVVQIHAKTPVLRSFRLIAHKHSFKVVHHRHTSHLTLIVILIIVGFFMYASSSLAEADTSSGSVTIGATVPAPPPAIGAVITSPRDGDTIKGQNIIDVSGTCSDDSFVVVKDNDVTVGSAACTSAGIFSLQIQLNDGQNVLSALNYDNLNQAGPITPSITVTVTQIESATPINNVVTTEIIPPLIPDNPSIIAGVPSSASYSNCDDYVPGKLTAGGPLHVSVVCVPRLFLPTIQQTMGVIVWGGTPPYALSVNFDDGSDNPTLVSLPAPGYKKIEFSYAVPNTYSIKFKLTDQKSQTAVVQTAVQVNGQTQSSASNAISNLTNEILGGKPWYESPVPFYLLAIAITLGFWGGDIFDRNYGAKYRHTRKKASA